MRQPLGTFCAVTLLLAQLPATASAFWVRGAVVAPPVPPGSPVVSLVRLRVVAPSPLEAGRKQDVAVFLKVKTSLPLSAPKDRPSISLDGLRLWPDIAACAVDGKVDFTNPSKAPITVSVGATDLGAIGPGETKTYECTVGSGGDEIRPVRVAEWPHLRATVFVGEVGVPGIINDKGAFQLEAPQGSYELLLVTQDGVRMRQPVEVAKDVDAGTLTVEAAPEGGQ